MAAIRFTAFTIICLALIAGSAAGMSIPDGKETAVRTFNQTLSAEGKVELDVGTTNGTIEIKSSEGEQITIDAEIAVRGRKQEVCEELAGEVKINVVENGDGIDIETKFPRKSGYATKVDFVIQLPARMSVEASSVNGAISINGIEGAVEAETVNGSILGQNLSGRVEAQSINGSIELGGDLKSVDVETVNGRVSVSVGKAAPEKLDIETVNGSVEFKAEGMPNARLSAEVANGRIGVKGIPQMADMKIGKQLSTVMGSGEGDYDIEVVNGSINIEIESPD